jgi:hypothetical protein
MGTENSSLSDLKYQYEKTMERRSTLTGQASNLMSFASIIDTIVIALLVGLVSNQDLVGLLSPHPHKDSITLLVLLAFIAYVITLVLALFAYWEPKWVMAPIMPPINGDYYKAAGIFIDKKVDYGDLKRAYQLINAIESTRKVNAIKYNLLQFAFISLICGIVITTAVAMIILWHVL